MNSTYDPRLCPRDWRVLDGRKYDGIFTAFFFLSLQRLWSPLHIVVHKLVDHCVAMVVFGLQYNAPCLLLRGVSAGKTTQCYLGNGNIVSSLLLLFSSSFARSPTGTSILLDNTCCVHHAVHLDLHVMFPNVALWVSGFSCNFSICITEQDCPDGGPPSFLSKNFNSLSVFNKLVRVDTGQSYSQWYSGPWSCEISTANKT